VEKEPMLDEIVSGIQDVDLILVEGYKQAGKPSIEIIRGDLGVRHLVDVEQVVAIAMNVKLNASVPVFDLNDARAIADFIELKFVIGYTSIVLP
jgi:molybdopterin-guanine dinucleotide biosynthesis protein MobB